MRITNMNEFRQIRITISSFHHVSSLKSLKFEKIPFFEIVNHYFYFEAFYLSKIYMPKFIHIRNQHYLSFKLTYIKITLGNFFFSKRLFSGTTGSRNRKCIFWSPSSSPPSRSSLFFHFKILKYFLDTSNSKPH